MGDTLKKVKSGDPMTIPAATFNSFVDAAQDFLRRQRDIARTPAAERPPFEMVLLKNASGADRGYGPRLFRRSKNTNPTLTKRPTHGSGTIVI